MTVFCQIADVLRAMDVEEAYTGHNQIVTLAIMQASALIRTYTRREWDEAQYTDFLNTSDIDLYIGRGNGVYIATLREKPISLTEGRLPILRYSPSGKWDDVEALPANTYHIDQRKNQVIMYPAVMRFRPRSLRVQYWAGYPVLESHPDVLDVPDHIKMACVAQASYLARQQMNETHGTNSKEGMQKFANRVSNAAGLTRDALALLRHEARLFVGGNA